MPDDVRVRNTKMSGTVATLVGGFLLLLAFYSFFSILSKPLMDLSSIFVSWILGLILLLWGLRRLDVSKLETGAIAIVIVIFSFGLFIFLVILSAGQP
jgi:hypothetical protein